jgi:hypothetical protein
MVDFVTKSKCEEFQGLPGTQALGDSLYLSGPYKVTDAPSAHSFRHLEVSVAAQVS